MAANTHTMTIPSSTRFLEEVREFVTTHAVQAGFNETTVEQMKMAVDEACTNVIEHSYKGQSGQPVDISIHVDPEKLVVVIRDKGKEFDRKAYVEPDLLQFAKSATSYASQFLLVVSEWEKPKVARPPKKTIMHSVPPA